MTDADAHDRSVPHEKAEDRAVEIPVIKGVEPGELKRQIALENGCDTEPDETAASLRAI